LLAGWRCYFIYLDYLSTIERIAENKGFVEVVEVQEYKLYKYIGNPAMWGNYFKVALYAIFNSFF